MPADREVIDAIEKLTTGTADLREQVSVLNEVTNAQAALGQESRKRIRRSFLAITGIILSLIIDFGVTWYVFDNNARQDKLLVEVRAAQSVAKQALNNQKVVCESTSASNATQKGLWTSILALPPTTPETDEQKQRRADFVVLLDKTFAVQTCGQGGK